MKIWGEYLALISADAAGYADALAAHCADVILLPPCSAADRRYADHLSCLRPGISGYGGYAVPTNGGTADSLEDIHRRAVSCGCSVQYFPVAGIYLRFSATSLSGCDPRGRIAGEVSPRSKAGVCGMRRTCVRGCGDHCGSDDCPRCCRGRSRCAAGRWRKNPAARL